MVMKFVPVTVLVLRTVAAFVIGCVETYMAKFVMAGVMIGTSKLKETLADLAGSAIRIRANRKIFFILKSEIVILLCVNLNLTNLLKRQRAAEQHHFVFIANQVISRATRITANGCSHVKRLGA